MKTIFFGTPGFAATVLEALLNSRHTVAAVVSQPDRPRGRGKKTEPTPVRALAEAWGVPVLAPERVRDKAFAEELSGFGAGVFTVAAYGQILPGKLLVMPPLGCVNVHASLLPKYRGASPIAQAVINGDAEAGVTIMQMNKGMDTGDMLLKRAIPIEPGDTAGSLEARLASLGAEALLAALDLLETGGLTPVPQDNSQATRAPMLRKEMGRLDYHGSAEALSNLVRGMDPWPGAYTETPWGTLKVWKARQEPGGALLYAGSQPGSVTAVGGEGVTVACCSGSLVLQEVQAPGGRRMPAGEYVRGHSIPIGTIFM